MHGAAGKHRAIAQRPVRAGDLHLREHVAQRVVGGAVDHHAHGAVGVVLAQQHHAAGEVRIGKRRQRDQQLAGKRGGGNGHARHSTGKGRGRPPRYERPNWISSGVATRTSTTSTSALKVRPASGWLPSTVTESPSTAVTTTSIGPLAVCASRRAPTRGAAPSGMMLRGWGCTSSGWRGPKPLSGVTVTSKRSPGERPSSASSRPATMLPVPCMYTSGSWPRVLVI